MRLRAQIVLFHMYYWTGYFTKATEILDMGNRLAFDTGEPYWIVLLFSYQSRLLRSRGQLRQAQKICGEALDFASGKSNVYQATSNIHISFADLLLDTNQLAEASSQVRIGLEIGLKWTNLVAIFFCYMGLIRLQLCERNFEGAKNTLLEAEQSIKNSKIDYELQALLISIKVRLWLAQGDIDTAAEWLNNHAFDEI